MNLLASLSLLLASSIGISTPISTKAANNCRLEAERNLRGNVVLRIYNSDDYMLNEIDDSLIKDFEKYVLKTDNVNMDVVYSTFPTNEEMLSRIQTGAAQYDLICTSDYVIQKMIAKDIIEPFVSGEEREKLYHGETANWNDNYQQYASKYLRDYLDTIKANQNGEEVPLSKYSKGYMWGTLGLTYNSAYHTFKERGMSEDEVKCDLSEWTCLWDEKYKGTYQIKDSMRDTYALGLMKTFDPLFQKIKYAYDKGEFSDEKYTEYQNILFNNINHLEKFNELDKKFNPDHSGYYTNEKIVNMVQESLSTLKKNCYGLEVDSGKTDITTGTKSGIGLAWSGDAIVSINEADNLDNGVKLYYSIPRTGGNIWFDAWVMQKYEGLNKEYAQKFIDFISEPNNAARNMEYIGYTSFIAGNGIRDLTRELYDPRLKYIYAYDETADSYLKDENNNLILKTSKKGIVEETIDGETHTIDYGKYDMTGSQLYGGENNLGFMIKDGEKVSWDALAEENSWIIRDLDYFFNKSSFAPGSLDNSPMFYTDEIENIKYTDKDGKVRTTQVGRQFLAQYPSKVDADRSSALNQIPGLAVMEDYGDNNIHVLRMWENFKSGGALNWTIVIVLILESTLAISAGLYFAIRTNASKRLRKKRRKEKENA